MDRGQRAVVIVGMLVEAAEALAADVDVEQVICRYLAQGVEADVAACFIPGQAAGERVLTCHPDRNAAAELVGMLGELESVVSGLAPLRLEHGRLGDVLVLAPAGFDPEHEDGRRALAFAKAEGFGDNQMMLLHEAVPPLMALLPHAVQATERRERLRAGEDAAREFGLTARELEVLELLAQGLLATSIASRLSLSPRTVHKHLGNIYDKLGVHDRLVAVSLARGRGLVAA